MTMNKKHFSLLKKSTLFGAALAVAFGINGCSSDDSVSAPTFSPFERVATLDVVLKTDGSGDVDYAATYAKTQAVAAAIHTYIETVDDALPVVDGGNGFPANWIIGGSDDLDPAVVDGILAIPSKDKIDPTLAEPDLSAKANTYKIQVMDICNAYYAKMALGVTNVVAGDVTSKVANGFIHAPTLPCEVSVYNDADNIYVDMLDPEAIFSLFFSDVLFGTQMDDATFSDAMMQLPADVKGELKTIIYAALEGDYPGGYTEMAQPMGPKYTQNQIPKVVDDSPYDSPYIHYAYMKADASEITFLELKGIAQDIINTLGLPDLPTSGTHEGILDDLLSPGSSWRSARLTPLGLPGAGADATAAPYKNFVIEACSPKYAKDALGSEATGPGRHHGPALPCEITVGVIQSTVDGPYDTLLVSFLEPGFMFNALFSDGFGAFDADTMAYYESLPGIVRADLKLLTDYALANQTAVTGLAAPLISLGELKYDMLP